MNKKRLILILSSICVLFLMTGCSTSDELIHLDTEFSSMTHEGVLAAVLVYPLAQAINYLSVHTGVFWAITIVATALNAIIIICTFNMNVSMQKMQELQPEVQKIQLKYEGRTDDSSQQRMAAELQQLYKKNGVNPIGSLVSTFIQLPVLISMYSAVRRSAAVASGTVLGASLSLTPKEAFIKQEWILIVIYVLMIVFQFVSTNVPRWVQTARDKKAADKRHKHYEKPANSNGVMMYSMVVLIAVLMISWPTALSLYYLIYSLINIVKTIVIDRLTHKDKE